MHNATAILIAGGIGLLVLILLLVLAYIFRRKPSNSSAKKLKAAQKILAAAGLSCEMAPAEYATKSGLGDEVIILRQTGGVICGQQPLIKTESVEEWTLSIVRWIANYKYSKGFKDAKRTKNV